MRTGHRIRFVVYTSSENRVFRFVTLPRTGETIFTLIVYSIIGLMTVAIKPHNLNTDSRNIIVIYLSYIID